MASLEEHGVDMRSIVHDAVLSSIETATKNGSGWLVSYFNLRYNKENVMNGSFLFFVFLPIFAFSFSF